MHETRVRYIRVHQQRVAIDLEGDAHGQVEGDEALAFRGDRAGHHDQVGTVRPGPDSFVGVPDDRALDDPEFVSNLRSLRLSRDEACSRQRVEVDLDHLAALPNLRTGPQFVTVQGGRHDPGRRGHCDSRLRKLSPLECLGETLRCGHRLTAITGGRHNRNLRYRNLDSGLLELCEALRCFLYEIHGLPFKNHAQSGRARRKQRRTMPPGRLSLRQRARRIDAVANASCA